MQFGIELGNSKYKTYVDKSVLETFDKEVEKHSVAKDAKITKFFKPTATATSVPDKESSTGEGTPEVEGSNAAAGKKRSGESDTAGQDKSPKRARSSSKKTLESSGRKVTDGGNGEASK